MKGVFSLNAQQLGQGPLRCDWQKRACSFLAAVGPSNTLHILDRHGEFADSMALSGECMGLEWTPEGDILSIIQSRSPYVLFWDARDRKVSDQMDTNMKYLQFLKWSPKGDFLAVGTARGNLLIFDRKESNRIPILGKHTKAIVSGCWSWDNILACGSEDKTFTLSNTAGDTIFSMSLTGVPSRMQWANVKNAHGGQDPVLSLIIADKTLFIHNINHPEAPIELAFQPKYGNVVAYQWFADGYVLVGFTTGYLIVISTNTNELGQEIFSTRNHKNSLSDIAISNILSKAASCGDNAIKVHELADLRDIYAVETVDDASPLDRFQWSDDGQFLTVTTKGGSLYTYLARMPMLGASYGTCVAHLTSLREVTIEDQAVRPGGETLRPVKKDFEIEPGIIALGGNHLGVVTDKRAGFYKYAFGEPAKGETTAVSLEGPPVMIKEYHNSVQSLTMNGYYAAALLTDGQLQVHAVIDNNPRESTGTRTRFGDITNTFRESKPPSNDVLEKIFPEHSNAKRKAAPISCVALSPECVIFGTSNGGLRYYLLEEWTLVAELKHRQGIQKIYPQQRGGTKVIFIDALNDGHLTDPTTNTIMAIPQWSATTQAVLWESTPPPGGAIFISYDDAFITTYVYQPFTIKGPACIPLGTTKLPFGHKPIVLSKGIVTCQTVAGKLTTLPLSTHESLTPDQFIKEKRDEQEQGKGLQLYYTLGMLKEVWSLVGHLTAQKPWTMLAEAALRVLDVPTAQRIYRQVLSDAGMVFSLQKLEYVEEKNLLAGHVCAFFGDISAAQEYFLKSSHPKAALHLRRNLMQWEQALTLANTLAPDEVTVIAKEYGQQLEMNSKYSEALAMYERALATVDQHPGVDSARDEHQIACSAGLVRMTLRLGDVSRGMKMLGETEDKQLLNDCGGILDTLKQYNEAAACYEKAGAWEKAAEMHIKAKNWTKIGKILDKITAPRIFLQYARAREAEKDYTEAARAYEKAKDYDSVVRILVEHLQNIDSAVAIVRQTRSRESAKLVSKFFQSIRDYKSVVEFFLMAGMREEAFELAQQRDVMERYAELIKDEATPEMLYNVASYLENKGSFMLAGRYLLQAGDYSRALRMFLQSPPEEGGIDLAIETVGKAKSDTLTHQLIDYLMGEADGMPKDAKYIFKLYMSLGQYREAARTAIIIAREEQALGNYRAAHDLLLDNYKQLKATKNHVPSEIERMLMLLHSYILVKTLVRVNDHEKGARMLIRVANNISKFPAHVVPILTSTVIECHRAGFKRAAFEYAAMLMRPEYRNKVDAKYRSRIEKMVRRPEKDEKDEPATPCPYCGNMVPETVLDCIECRNHIPYCIATGRHMTANDWTSCPTCTFPALYIHFKDLLSKTSQCPMCLTSLQPDQLILVPEPEVKALLHKKKSEKEKEEQPTEVVEKRTESRKNESRDSNDNGGGMASGMGMEKSRSFLRRSTNSVRIVRGGSTGEVAADTGDEVKVAGGLVA